MCNVLIATGGTGGHIYPAIAIGNFLKENNINVIFSGRKDSMEETLINKHGFQMVFIEAEKFKGVKTRKKILSILKLFKHIFNCMQLLRKLKINYLIGTGGFASFPMLIGAFLLNINSGICEQNAYMGFGNRILSFFVNDIYLSFYNTLNVPFRYKSVVAGNFIRREFENIKNSEKGILVFGGSQGAKKLNEIFLTTLEELKKIDNIKVYHITGERNFKSIEAAYKDFDGKLEFEVYPYYENIWELFNKVEVIISRAGATSVAEIFYTNKKAILIPYPYAADNHQWFNGKEFIKSGRGVVLNQDYLTGEKLLKWIKFFLNNNKRFFQEKKVLGDYKDGLQKILKRVTNV